MGKTVSEADVREVKREEIRQCYGAITSLRELIDHAVGTLDEIQKTAEFLRGDINEAIEIMNKIKKRMGELK